MQNYIKHVNFWPDLHNICGYHGNIQNDDHLIDIRKFSGEINEQILKVSDMNEILSFSRTFLYQNVDYIKLTNIQIYTRKRSSEANFR